MTTQRPHAKHLNAPLARVASVHMTTGTGDKMHMRDAHRGAIQDHDA
jgi:hypothetical protein